MACVLVTALCNQPEVCISDLSDCSHITCLRKMSVIFTQEYCTMGDDWDDDSPATNQPSAPGLTAVVRKYFAILHVLHIFCISGN